MASEDYIWSCLGLNSKSQSLEATQTQLDPNMSQKQLEIKININKDLIIKEQNLRETLYAPKPDTGIELLHESATVSLTVSNFGLFF